jgi:hypothetical protein
LNILDIGLLARNGIQPVHKKLKQFNALLLWLLRTMN